LGTGGPAVRMTARRGAFVGAGFVGLVGAATAAVRASWPRTRGTLAVLGLDGEVMIARDAHGVPHIRARTRRDLYLAQGFVHGQDRFFQLDIQRRSGLGRLAELLGPAALPVDRRQCRFGFPAAAAAELAALDAATVAALEAYAVGVNAALRAGRRPFEYLLLRSRPRPWRALDSLAWAKVVQWELSDDVVRTLRREDMVRAVGAERAAELLGHDPDDPDPTGGAGAGAKRTGGRADLPAPPAWDANADHLGSNAWAVAGARTATGAPLLANDMHLPFGLPGAVYEIGLHAPGYEAAGVSFPGLPGVVAGHNADVAWGIANTRARTMDLYEEEIDPADPGRYRTPDGWAAFEEHTEVIPVRGRRPTRLTVRRTRNGPVISDDERIGGDGRVLTLRSQPLDEPGPSVRALLRLGTVRSGDELGNVLAEWHAPVATFVWADRRGGVGAWCAGRIPVRPLGTPALPLAGAGGAVAWSGTVPYERLPHVRDPADGIVVSANARPGAPGDPYDLGPEWCARNREDRIAELLRGRTGLTVAALHRIQLDTVSLMARRLVPFLLRVEPGDQATATASALLREWDLRMAADSAAAGVYQRALRRLVADLAGAALDDPDLLAFYLTREQQYCTFVDRILDRPDSPWWTGRGGDRDSRIAAALTAAAAELAAASPNPASWAWGREHTAVFRHPLYGRVPGLRRFGDVIAGPVPGDPQTPFATGFLTTTAATSGPVHRQVADLADWDSCRQLAPPGQSGHLGHRHYRDQVTSWRDGGLHPLPWTGAAVARTVRHTLRLVPAVG
jgi:penicillin G amidase